MNHMFIVTTEGIIVVDGDCDNMQWLKSELQTRFKVPVKYVVLSHDHQGHICDTQVFADTAVGIGHVNIRDHIIREKRRSIVPQITFEDTMEIQLGGIRVVPDVPRPDTQRQHDLRARAGGGTALRT